MHNCGNIGCHVKLPLNERYCQQHASDNKRYQNSTSKTLNNRYYNQHNRDKEANQFYHSAQWIKLRQFVYVRAMACSEVSGKALPNDIGIVDHIVPLRVAPNKKLDADNLWLLSKAEHNIKTMLEQQLLDSPNGLNKVKHVSKDWYRKQIIRLMNKEI